MPKPPEDDTMNQKPNELPMTDTELFDIFHAHRYFRSVALAGTILLIACLLTVIIAVPLQCALWSLNFWLMSIIYLLPLLVWGFFLRRLWLRVDAGKPLYTATVAALKKRGYDYL